ncbi:cysteine hydrolase family protein [Mycoplasma sp. 2634B]|uniref:cysteine hydrolase family protein n=1 Tax=Mycoplasma sp. 2634B TaxID=3401692 RepID=UPI003AACCBA5
MDKKLLIVVDMLNGFAYNGALASQNIAKIVPQIARILAEFDHNLFVCDHHSTDDLEMQLYPIHCLANDVESEIVPELAPYAQEIVFKNTTNAFWDIPTKTWDLYDEFYLVGCCTDICILQLGVTLKTYLNKIHSDKNVIVLQNALATYDSKEHNATEYTEIGLKALQNAGVIIKTWEQ